MFESLSEKLQKAFGDLRRKGRLTDQDVNDALRQIKLVLKQRFAIAHTTIQLEAAGCADQSEDAVAGCH